MYVSSFIVKFSTPLSPLSPSEAPKGGVRCTKYVLRRCVLCICRLKKNVWEVAWKNIFVLLANCLECARALVLGAICIQCALRLTPPPPPAPLVKGEFAVAYSHVHFGERCIRILLICLLPGKLPPSPAGKR